MESATLFLASRFATSQTEIAEIRIPPAPLAERILWRHVGDSFPEVASASQNQTCVSSSSGSTVSIPDFACRPDDVAEDGHRALHVAENIRALILERDKLGDRLAALGNHDLTVVVPDLDHQFQTLRLESAGRHGGRFSRS